MRYKTIATIFTQVGGGRTHFWCVPFGRIYNHNKAAMCSLGCIAAFFVPITLASCDSVETEADDFPPPDTAAVTGKLYTEVTYFQDAEQFDGKWYNRIRGYLNKDYLTNVETPMTF